MTMFVDFLIKLYPDGKISMVPTTLMPCNATCYDNQSKFSKNVENVENEKPIEKNIQKQKLALIGRELFSKFF